MKQFSDLSCLSEHILANIIVYSVLCGIFHTYNLLYPLGAKKEEKRKKKEEKKKTDYVRPLRSVQLQQGAMATP